MNATITLPQIIRNAFALPSLASQHQDAIAKAMRASEFRYAPMMPTDGSAQPPRNGTRNLILSLLSDERPRTLEEIGEALGVEKRSLNGAVHRATESGFLAFYTMPNRKRVYRLSIAGREAVEKVGRA